MLLQNIQVLWKNIDVNFPIKKKNCNKKRHWSVLIDIWILNTYAEAAVSSKNKDILLQQLISLKRLQQMRPTFTNDKNLYRSAQKFFVIIIAVLIFME